jgi:hypothetical protein
VAGRESEFSGMNRGNKVLVRRALVTHRLRRPRFFASTAGEFPRNSGTKLAQETWLRRALSISEPMWCVMFRMLQSLRTKFNVQ